MTRLGFERLQGVECGHCKTAVDARRGVGHGAVSRRFERFEARLPVGRCIIVDVGIAGQRLDPGVQRPQRIGEQRHRRWRQAATVQAQAVQMAFDRCGETADGHRIDHGGAALECMERPDRFGIEIEFGVPRVLCFEPVPDDAETLARVVAEDYAHVRLGLRLFAFGEAAGASDQRGSGGAFAADTAEVFDQPGQQVDGFTDHLEHRRAQRQRAFEEAVEHILDRPAELADAQRADHAAAALERVEGTAHAEQHFAVARIAPELRQVPAQFVEHFTGLLDEDVANLRVDVIGDRR